jgi:Super-infection exclusion protein B
MDAIIKSINEVLKSIFPILKEYFWPIVLFVAASGWAIIILPPRIFGYLQIDKLRLSSLETIGSVTFISTFALCFGLVWKGIGLVKAKREIGQEAQRKIKLLQHLTPMERACLLNYVKLQSQTATFSLYDGVVAGLIDKGVLYKPNSLANIAGEQDFNMFPWAYDYLSSHRETFDPGGSLEGQNDG